MHDLNLDLELFLVQNVMDSQFSIVAFEKGLKHPLQNLDLCRCMISETLNIIKLQNLRTAMLLAIILL